MPPFQHVLVPVDLSHRSRRTVAEAVAIARASGAQVSLLHVARPFLDSESREDLLLQLWALVEPHERTAPIHCDVAEGDAVEEIVSFANAESDIDLIVVGAHPRGAVAWTIGDAVGDRITREAPCSVLVVGEDNGAPNLPRLQTVLCAVDSMDTSRNTLDIAAATAAGAGARLIALHVIDPARSIDPDVTSSRDLEEARNVLDRSAAERLAVLLIPHAAAGLSVERLVLSGAAGPLIVESAATLHADLMVLGAHSTRSFGRTHLGATAQYVRRTAPCPLLLARRRVAAAHAVADDQLAQLAFKP